MRLRSTTLRWLPALFVVLILAACEETTLETAPEGIAGAAADQCPDPVHTSGESESGDWGRVDGINQGVSWDINPGYTALICVRVGNDIEDRTLTNQGTETWNGFNHWSLLSTGGGPTTTTDPDGSTTTTDPDGSTTIDGTTTLTEAGGSTVTLPVTTTDPDGSTTTTEPDGAPTTTTVTAPTTTAPDDGPTLTEGGGPGGVTTTVEIGDGTLEPGQVTSTTAGPSTTADPGEETTTTDEEVAGGSEGSLPYTGAGDMTMGGMAGLLVAAGIVILLLLRRKSGPE